MSIDQITDGGAAPATPPEPAGSDTEAPAPGKPERTLLDLIAGIRAGSISPKALGIADRHACVAHLSAEGLSTPQIAQVLSCSDRTIERDKKKIQEANTLRHDPALAGRMAGMLLVEAQNVANRLRRIGREKDCPHESRIAAERAAFQTLSELVGRLQSLGFLPTAAQRLEASVTHHAGEIPDLEQIEAEAIRLRSIAAALSPGSAQTSDLDAVLAQTQRARLASRVHDIAATIEAASTVAPEESLDAAGA